MTLTIILSFCFFRSFSKIGAKKNLEILGNCNYAVELGKKINLILVGIEGNDIKEGNRTLTLGLIWQLMRKYTLTLLAKLSPDGTPIVETEIITWANQRLEGKGVTIRHFGVRFLNPRAQSYLVLTTLTADFCQGIPCFHLVGTFMEQFLHQGNVSLMYSV